MSFDDFMNSLSPSVRKSVQIAKEFETVTYPWASLGLTLATGGLGAGRVHTVYGNPSAGKSMLALQTIAKLQKEYGLVCGYADVEATFDKEFSKSLGVNNDELLIATSRSGGQLSNNIIPWIEKGIDLIVVDSISDILPESYIDKDGLLKEADDRKQIGSQSKAVTNLINGIHYANKKTIIILLSQTSTRIESYGSFQAPTSGKKVEFASSQMIKLNSSNTDKEQIKQEVMVGKVPTTVPVGRHVEATVEKNKIGPPKRIAKWDIYYGGDNIGIDFTEEIITLAVDYGVIEKVNNRTTTYRDNTWTSKSDMIAGIKNSQGIYDSIEEELKEMVL